MESAADAKQMIIAQFLESQMVISDEVSIKSFIFIFLLTFWYNSMCIGC